MITTAGPSYTKPVQAQSSHLSTEAKCTGPVGDHYRQVPRYHGSTVPHSKIGRPQVNLLSLTPSVGTATLKDDMHWLEPPPKHPTRASTLVTPQWIFLYKFISQRHLSEFNFIRVQTFSATMLSWIQSGMPGTVSSHSSSLPMQSTLSTEKGQYIHAHVIHLVTALSIHV